LALPLPTVYAWGTLGHTTVAYVAQHFVSAKTAKWAKSILNDTSDSYLANSATWADSYRYTAEGGFSSVFHYIDALDNPPQTCNVVFERDCPEEGCIVSALANYTQRVKSKKFPAIEVQKALKWIIHFTGDITQPLHDENLMIGGNLINVTFNGLATNLHASWDTRIPEKRIGGYNLTYASSWASTITHSIEKGAYRKSKKSWLRNLNVRHPLSTAMTWARDGNSFVCTAVIPNGVEAVERKEIGGDYADMAFPVVEQQIAKAGYRLAAWLNLL
ncbi:S1/P1 nuclease, partial [Patellaria atrata CBS 101060]